MADDKGGKTWEPFEIVLVILLLVGLLTTLQGEPAAKKAVVTPPKKSTPAAVPARNTCGLSVVTPRNLEKVSDNGIWLSGTTNGCTWQSTESVALYAQVIDAKGKPISEYVAVSPLTTAGSTTSFATTMLLNGQPSSGKGTLILLPAQARTEEAVTVRIPITF